MNKFEMLKYLLDEVEKEKKKVDIKTELEIAFYNADTQNRDKERKAFYAAEEGSKLKIKEYLKMVRRVTLEIEKELQI